MPWTLGLGGKAEETGPSLTSQREMRGWRQPLPELRVTHRPFGGVGAFGTFLVSMRPAVPSFQGEEGDALGCLLKCVTELVLAADRT